jgi:hypothetical protein
VNGGVDGEGIWLTAFIYICEIEQWNLWQLFEAEQGVGCRAGGGWWGDLTNVQYKTIQNCHNESPLNNEYKNGKKLKNKRALKTYSENIIKIMLRNLLFMLKHSLVMNSWGPHLTLNHFL